MIPTPLRPGRGSQAQSHWGSHLAGDSVRLPNLVLLVPSPHKDNGQLGQDDVPLDGSGYHLRVLNTKTNVTTVVPSSNKSLKPRSLARPSLLLYWHDL